jgi:hypothetical protein
MVCQETCMYHITLYIISGGFREGGGPGQGARTSPILPEIYYQMLVKFKTWDPKHVKFLLGGAFWNWSPFQY